MIEFFYCYSQSRPFENLCDDHRAADFLQLVATCIGVSVPRTQKLLSTDGRLLRVGVIEPNGISGSPYFELDDEVLHYLTGLASGSLAERYCREDSGPAFALDTFSVQPRQAEMVSSLLRSKRPCHILLHGEAGTGKTEFARSVASAAGLRACFVKEGEKGVASDRKLELHAAVSAVPADKALLIMDEADTLLNTEGGHIFGGRVDKGWVNDFMDRSKCVIVWIVNELAAAPGSVRRRFDYSLEFKPFTRRQREAIWNEVASGSPLKAWVTPDMIRELSAKYRVNAAGVASALAAARHIVTPETSSPAFVMETLEELLERHQELTVGAPNRQHFAPVAQYDISALNTDVPAERLVTSLEGFVGEKPWDSENAGRMNLLFWGLPGTGKTEFAKYLASSLGLDLILKPASQLLSCWLGETEKNIAAAFDEATREQAILFIDEADSFFTERQSANRSWEVTQTNELLEQMENHQGILICCTNLLENLDRAALRRFAWKVEFKALTPEARVAVYRKYFIFPGRKFLTTHRDRLCRISGLTFGDFRAVSDKFSFHSQASPAHADVLDALEIEAAYRSSGKKGPLGFKG